MFDARKYRAHSAPRFSERLWPERSVTHAPIWCSVDLRDGNQALVEPMGSERKLRLFEKLVAIGCKEIEVGFPAASQTDFDFVRMLVDETRIPADVTIQVLTQARESLIARTIESLRGARQAIVHLYNSTNPVQRKVVFGMIREQVRALAVQGATWVKQMASRIPETDLRLEYSPESFSATEPEFAVEVVDAVIEAWNPSPRRKLIVNLPATVESAMPNVYADQIEWMGKHIARRDEVIVSVHTHNDRGCAVAAAELAMLAGAERVEGTLFGNGERTGNADLVTLAMNLYSQGVAPGLDLSDMPALVEVYETCTQMPVPARHPYAGELVFTAFSGSHQDAIAKGLAARASQASAVWEVPYLPMDPADVGRDYEPLIRINSQSGKSGIRYVLEHAHGYKVPKDMAIEIGRLVQVATDQSGKELPPDAVLEIFEKAFLRADGRFRLVDYDAHHEAADSCHLKAKILDGECEVSIEGEGTGAIDAFSSALGAHAGMRLTVVDYAEHALAQGTDAEAVAYVRVEVGGRRAFGVGRDVDIVTASLHAVVRAVNVLSMPTAAENSPKS
jgi:2-isopropylmalate synthase